MWSQLPMRDQKTRRPSRLFEVCECGRMFKDEPKEWCRNMKAHPPARSWDTPDVKPSVDTDEVTLSDG